MELNREQIIKALECWTSEYGCTGCPFIEQGCFDCGHILEISKSILALINSQEQRIGAQDMTISELRQRAEKAEHDADRYARKIKELTEENEKLSADNEIKSQKRANIFEISNAFDRGRTDGVRKIVKRVEEAPDILNVNGYSMIGVDIVIQFAKEMLEGACAGE